MGLARSRRGDSGMNYWPGFVDALSTLILSIIFILTVFVVVQFFLQQELSGKDTALNQLNAQIAQLTDLLSLEKTNKSNVEDQLAQLRASLATAEGDRDKFKGIAEGAGTGLSSAQSKVGELTTQLEGQRRISSQALAQVEILNQQIAAFRRQLAALESALDASEKKDKEAQTRIADLGSRLNIALAQKVEELKGYRSDFFGRLRQIIGTRSDIRIVGDRFVLQSELLFDVGKADLKPEAMPEIDKIAAAMTEIGSKIPADIPWVLRVDGHTDIRPTGSTGAYKSNWDLSVARAVSVVQYLASKGLPPQHLLAAGFGEFQPIDTGTTEEAYRRNRRIEFKLTER